MEEILNSENTPRSSKYKKWRIFSYLLEGVPILLSLCLLLTGFRKEIFLGSFALGLIYIFAGWFLFKTDKHNWYNIVIATIAGLSLAIVIFCPIIDIMTWRGDSEILIVGILTVIMGTVGSLVLAVICTLISEDKKQEYGMS